MCLQLATTDLYRDFVLLDTSDADALNEYLRGNKVETGQSGAYRGSSNRKSFHSPRGRSAGSAHKNSAAKSQQANANFTPLPNLRFDADNIPISSPASAGFANCNIGLHADDGCDAYPSNNSSDDEDDPWKPLNPHEPGNLRVKPFRKGFSTPLYHSINLPYPYYIINYHFCPLYVCSESF